MRTTGPGRAAVLPLIGGRLCLDFVNTRGWRHGERPEEHLARYEDLLTWSMHAEILNDADAALLRGNAHTTHAASVFGWAIALREAMYGMFEAIAAGRAPCDADLHIINDRLGRALRHLQVGRSGGRFTWQWDRSTSLLESPLWPIARSCAELLVSGDAAKVRVCAGEPCGWLFLDASKNRSRRWCDTRDCGNRIRLKRHYARKRAPKVKS
jgi:predicted RNA-binding Zn ribbon-like protein